MTQPLQSLACTIDRKWTHHLIPVQILVSLFPWAFKFCIFRGLSFILATRYFSCAYQVLNQGIIYANNWKPAWAPYSITPSPSLSLSHNYKITEWNLLKIIQRFQAEIILSDVQRQIQDKADQGSGGNGVFLTYPFSLASLWAYTFQPATETAVTSGKSEPRQIKNKRARIPWRLQEETRTAPGYFHDE